MQECGLLDGHGRDAMHRVSTATQCFQQNRSDQKMGRKTEIKIRRNVVCWMVVVETRSIASLPEHNHFNKHKSAYTGPRFPENGTVFSVYFFFHHSFPGNKSFLGVSIIMNYATEILMFFLKKILTALLLYFR